MQSAVLFSGIPGPDRKVACLGYPTSGIPMEAKTADYIRPTLAATIVAQKCGPNICGGSGFLDSGIS
jgi:hypothetical protein